MDQQSLALTGLTSRGGLSNWVVFILPTEAILIDVGMKPAVMAGLRAGAGAQFGVAGRALASGAHGPQNDAGKALDDWRAELQAKAKQVRVLGDADIRRVRLHLKATAHELIVVVADGSTQTFGIMNRAAAPKWEDVLARRFGNRFETTTSPTFAFFKRYAPFLMS